FLTRRRHSQPVLYSKFGPNRICQVNGILKTEYLLDETFPNVQEAYKATRRAVEKYNEARPHWSLNLMKPSEVHKCPSVVSPPKSKDGPSREPVKAKMN